MVVDFVIRKSPEFKLATRTLKGSWPGDKKLQAEFEAIAAWAKEKGIRTGKWVFTEIGDMEIDPEKTRYEMGIEIRSKAPVRGARGISIRTLPATHIATVTFNPDQVSPRVVYHGLTDWLKFREKYKEYKTAGNFREVYTGNPWSSKKAWSKTQVQAPVKKLAH